MDSNLIYNITQKICEVEGPNMLIRGKKRDFFSGGLNVWKEFSKLVKTIINRFLVKFYIDIVIRKKKSQFFFDRKKKNWKTKNYFLFFFKSENIFSNLTIFFQIWKYFFQILKKNMIFRKSFFFMKKIRFFFSDFFRIFFWFEKKIDEKMSEIFSNHCINVKFHQELNYDGFNKFW